MVAGLEAGDRLAGGAHDAGALVAEHGGERHGLEIGVAAVLVGGAHAGGDDLDQQFVVARIVQIERFDGEGRVGLVHHRGGDLHGSSATRLFGRFAAGRGAASCATRSIICARYSGACAPDTA